MHMEFDPKMEAIIEDQYKRGVVDLPARVIMLIGKLTYLERQHAKLEIEEDVVGHREEEFKRISAKKEKLENDIEDLDDDIAYLIYKIQGDA